MGRTKHLLLRLAVAFTLAAPSASRAADHVVSILPLRDLVATLAGTDDVDVLVGPGATPALYEPTARQMAGLARAEVLFVVGVPFETTFLPRIEDRFEGLRIVDAAAGIERIELPSDHGHDHDHAHDVDPHVWTDPRLVLRMIDTIAAALVDIEPGRVDAIEAARQELIADWTALDRELEAALTDVSPRVIAVFHPSFGYFASRYGFQQVAVESGGTEAGPRHLTRLARQVRDLRIDRLIVQPQFSPQRARALARTLDVEIIEIDPLDPDVPAMLRELTTILGGAPSGARR